MNTDSLPRYHRRLIRKAEKLGVVFNRIETTDDALTVYMDNPSRSCKVTPKSKVTVDRMSMLKYALDNIIDTARIEGTKDGK